MPAELRKGADIGMIRCPSCGHITEYTSPICPSCHTKYTYSDQQIDDTLEEIAQALEAREFETALEGYHILADMGHTTSQREYASMLESGDIVAKDLDAAMHYFSLAAEKNDAYSAYRYARLAERHSEVTASFWLHFAAVLGCTQAYPVLADRLSREGDDENANYYYALAAACDDTDAIVTLAKRYYGGIGAQKNDGYAKWYLDKLVLPPIHAIKMAYKLRTVKAEDPGDPTLPDYDRMLRRLAIKAQKLGYKTAYHRLCQILSERSDMQARMILGMLYAEGVGTRQDTKQAIDLLMSAAVHGNAEAYRHLGDIYVAGVLVERDTEKALEHYKNAANLGMANAYEVMGDIFYDGKLVERDIPEAIKLYELGAKEGHESCRTKADALLTKREDFFSRAVAIEDIKPDEAFKLYAIATGMGYIPAYSNLARCFENGIGTAKDRQKAFYWYDSAVNAGDTSSLYPLGLCYSRGIGTAFNFKKAIEVLTRASRNHAPEALDEIKRLYENKKKHLTDQMYSLGVELIYMGKFEESQRALMLCMRAKHGKAIYTLGCLNEFGLGIPTNRELAFKLYELAFELKFRDPRAIYKLKILKMARAYTKR